MEPIRVLITDDHLIVREGLRLILETAEYVEVVGEARDGAECLRIVAELAPDVVLMDLQMPGMDGMAMDLNDYNFDAYLANDRTLDDPEVLQVDKGGRVLVRVINAAAATVFWIDTGSLPGRLVAVDGCLLYTSPSPRDS